MTEDVWRHYAHMVGTTLMIEPYKLGPQPVGATPNLYEIPPALPPVGPVVDIPTGRRHHERGVRLGARWHRPTAARATTSSN